MQPLNDQQTILDNIATAGTASIEAFVVRLNEMYTLSKRNEENPEFDHSTYNAEITLNERYFEMVKGVVDYVNWTYPFFLSIPSASYSKKVDPKAMKTKIRNRLASSSYTKKDKDKIKEFVNVYIDRVSNLIKEAVKTELTEKENTFIESIFLTRLAKMKLDKDFWRRTEVIEEFTSVLHDFYFLKKPIPESMNVEFYGFNVLKNVNSILECFIKTLK
jgi:hypothetical protein